MPTVDGMVKSQGLPKRFHGEGKIHLQFFFWIKFRCWSTAGTTPPGT